jgi:hypothetical protein
MFVLAGVIALTGCAADDQSSDEGTVSSEPEVAAATAQEVTLFDCQKGVAACTKNAKSFFDLAGCTVKFQSCTVQSAADLAGQSNLLKNCRSKADACLLGAVTVTDISACRSVYEACAGDVVTATGDVVKEAVDVAKGAIDKTVQIAIDTIGDLGGITSDALDAVAACQAQAGKCLEGVVTVSNVSECQDVLEECTSHAIDLVDTITDPLPGPNPGEIIEGFSDCQASSQLCLTKAVTSLDISKCQNTLATCVGDATDLIDQTIDDVNQILPIPLPSPTKPIDCTAQATQCLLQLKNPIDCATQAAQCLQ